MTPSIPMETPTSDSKPQTDSTPAPAIDLNDLAREAQELLSTMLPLLSFEAKLTPEIEKNSIRIRMESADAGRLIGRRGSTVNEIQFLINRILQRRHKTTPRIYLDVEDTNREAAAVEEPRVQEEQEQPADVNTELATQVKAVASQVNRWGDPVEMGPLNAADLKIVCDMLAKNRELEVIPLGNGRDGMQKIRVQSKS